MQLKDGSFSEPFFFIVDVIKIISVVEHRNNNLIG